LTYSFLSQKAQACYEEHAKHTAFDLKKADRFTSAISKRESLIHF
jgi:hypothetical protein